MIMYGALLIAVTAGCCQACTTIPKHKEDIKHTINEIISDAVDEESTIIEAKQEKKKRPSKRSKPTGETGASQNG
jgi:hypothetical protein